MSKTDQKISYGQLTLGIVKSLEKRIGVCDVKMTDKPPLERHHITQWEQKYSCLMPDDVKNFYMTANGMKLTWSVKINDTKIPVGKIELNGLERLIRVGGVSGVGATASGVEPNLLDIVDEEDLDPSIPQFNHKSRLFELCNCDGHGKVCLVFRETKPAHTQKRGKTDKKTLLLIPSFQCCVYQQLYLIFSLVLLGIPAHRAEVWFLDRALRWHPLAHDFGAYFRLQLVHLGLPHWWYAFTDIGLSPQAKQWFSMYAPLRMEIDEKLSRSGNSDETPQNKLDLTRVFKGKSEKKKLPLSSQSQALPKKRPVLPSGAGKPSGAAMLNRTLSGPSQHKTKTDKT